MDKDTGWRTFRGVYRESGTLRGEKITGSYSVKRRWRRQRLNKGRTMTYGGRDGRNMQQPRWKFIDRWQKCHQEMNRGF